MFEALKAYDQLREKGIFIRVIDAYSVQPIDEATLVAAATATGKQIIELLFKGHVERGTTLVLVTHDSALAQRCDRIVRLRSGRVDSIEPKRRES